MRQVLVVLGSVFIILILIGGAVAGYIAYTSVKFYFPSLEYASESVSAIGSNGSEDEFIRRASPELRAVITKGQLDQFFAALKKLGPLQDCSDLKGTISVHLSPIKGQIITGQYVTTAHFAKGKAQIRINVILEDGAWRLLGFYVNPLPMIQ